MDVLAKYVEPMLKGGNRRRFERKLLANLRAYLEHNGFNYRKIDIYGGRILIYDIDRFPDLSKVLGISFYSPVKTFGYDLDSVENYIRTELADNLRSVKSFRVTTRRADKSFPLNSIEVQRRLGAVVHNEFGVPVDLKHPELEIFVEIANGRIWVYTDSYRGFGGLPVGTEGTLVALLSGGIDSPVAAFLMMRRGAKLILLHISFHGEDLTVIHELHEKLSEYARGEEPELVIYSREDDFGFDPFKFHSLPFSRYTCLICKHLMLKAAEKLAEERGALGIVTGDTLGQVASQTLANMKAYRSGIELPIYSPLIGMDKVETIAWAQKIGTYEISVKHKDAGCAPPRPITKASIEEFKKVMESAKDYLHPSRGLNLEI